MASFSCSNGPHVLWPIITVFDVVEFIKGIVILAQHCHSFTWLYVDSGPALASILPAQ